MNDPLSHRLTPGLGFAAGVLAVGMVSVSGGSAAAVQGAGPVGGVVEDSPAVFATVCGECHDTRRVVAQRRTREEWADNIRKMIEEGAVGTEADFQVIFAYLVRNAGKIFVNSAAASDLQEVLGLSDAEAKAIVAFRTTNGPFANVEALKKVPSIDARKVDEQKDAMAFDRERVFPP